MKKRWIPIFMLVLALLLTSCGNNPESSDPAKTDQTKSSTEKAKVSTKTTDAPVEVTPHMEIDLGKTTEQLIADTDGFRLMLTEVVKQSDESIDLKFVGENKTDHEISFSSGDVYVNGVHSDAIAFLTADPKQTVEFSVNVFEDYTLQGLEISDYTEIEINWEVLNLKDLKYMYRGALRLYPKGMDKAERYVPDHSSHLLLLENEWIRLWAMDLETIPSYGEKLTLYAESKIDYTIRLNTDEVLVNGKEMFGFIGDLIHPGKDRVFNFLFPYAEMEAKQIKEIQSIKFTLYSTYLDNLTKKYFEEDIEIKIEG